MTLPEVFLCMIPRRPSSRTAHEGPGPGAESCDPKLRIIKCPSCSSWISVEQEWTTVCQACGKVVSTRRPIYPPSHYLNGSDEELLQTYIDYVESNLAPQEWGFRRNALLPKKLTVIYDSEYCRVKFVLRGSDYGPLYASSIYYGRLHAPDDEVYMNWRGESCRCWHRDSEIMMLTLPFLEEMSPEEISLEPAEFWQQREQALGAYPSDEIEYQLSLHSRIWERYGEKLFHVFDLRQPDLWEKYAAFSETFKRAWHKRWNINHEIERIC